MVRFTFEAGHITVTGEESVVTLIGFPLGSAESKQLTGWEEAKAHMALKRDPGFLESGLQLVS